MVGSVPSKVDRLAQATLPLLAGTTSSGGKARVGSETGGVREEVQLRKIVIATLMIDR
jgi:hypothetical protein